MRNLWASFEFLVHFLIIFFIVQSFKNEILSKILDIQKYNIVRHWFSSKNWIFAIFFKKVSIDGFTHYLWKILLIFIVQSFKNEISSKILDTQKYNIVRHWFSSKNWIFSIFFKKVSIDGFTHFSSKIHPNFSKKINFSIYPNILYIYDQNFMLVPTIKLLEFSDKNWETYERLLNFWSIFLLFFLLSKVSKMKFYQKSLIYKNTTLYDIDFPQKIYGFLRFYFFKKVSIDGFTHYLWKILLIFIVQSFKNEISSKILDTQKYNIVRHWFFSKNWIFSIFFKKVSIDGFTHFSSKIHPKFSKNQLFHIPQYIIYLWSKFYARSNNQTIRIFG